jgi:hypothetical protein
VGNPERTEVELQTEGAERQGMMANQHDSSIVEGIMRLPFPANVDAFFRYGTNLVDHSTYWQMLAAMWIGHGGTDRLDEWTKLFRSDRPSRCKLMKKKDRQFWRRLPTKVIAYRAVDPVENLSSSISWTLDPSFLARVYRDREIVTREFQKKDILAYFNRRGESEIIVLPKVNG